jgi:AmiR/NasT family two-component response regulator
MEADPPRILLGNLRPILRLGLVAMLTEAGMDVVAQEQRAHRIISETGRLRPDAVVLDRDDGQSRTLSARVRQASPNTTVILWARDESLIEVLEPGSDTERVLSPAVSEDLRSELARSSSENLVEE